MLAGRMVLEPTLCGITNGDLVAPEQQCGLFGREQLGHEHGEPSRS